MSILMQGVSDSVMDAQRARMENLLGPPGVG